MIRLVTLDEFDPALLKQLTKTLYTSFGVGSEVAEGISVPQNQQEPFNADRLLEAIPKVTAFADDKVLFLTMRKLQPRKLPSGEVPTYGFSRYGAQRCIVTTAHIKDPLENIKQVARFCMHELGHCFGLHHCLDARCSMYPHWSLGYLNGDSIFCVFCRDTSEQRIRQTKS
jgi:archaemetzincin